MTIDANAESAQSKNAAKKLAKDAAKAAKVMHSQINDSPPKCFNVFFLL
jgi:hypothetical protein